MKASQILLQIILTSMVGLLVECADKVEKTASDYELLVVTVATDETDGYRRFIRSTIKYGVNVKTVGMGLEWRGGDIARSPGGGFKINLLKAALEEYKDREDLIIMFSDSYDVIFTAGPDEILKKFRSLKANLVFSAENFIWPDRSLHDQYPQPNVGYPYLCSGLYIGYAPFFWKALTYKDIGDLDDDQLFYTKLYLDETKRVSWKIKLDHLSTLFFNLNGAQDDIKLRFEGANSMLHNTLFNTVPSIVHGNGPTKVHLNRLGNYLANQWTEAKGCLGCGEDRIDMNKMDEGDYPTVVMALILYESVPFVEEYFQGVENQDYPKDKIHLYVFINTMFHYHDGKNFAAKWENEYRSTKVIIPAVNLTEGEGRNEAFTLCNKVNCDYVFAVDGNVRISNNRTLKNLIEQNKPVIAPMIPLYGKFWTNFWGDLNSEGFYQRSEDYIDIVKLVRKGVWNVPFISSIYLVKGDRIRGPVPPSYIEGLYDPDMAFCMHLRERGIFIFVSNIYETGHFINTEGIETTHLHNDLWEIKNNQYDWEQKYIHPDYYKARVPGVVLEEPCTDVFYFPLFTYKFTSDFIEEMEHFGQWSGGGNEDTRLDGGYENVPTRDIHMTQVGLQEHWLHFLKTYIGPVCENIYWGYSGRHYALLNFIVRYKPEEQPALRPHHDSSTYTINIALNTQGVDYEGGGARFTRYNCSVPGQKRGWTLIHPGKLTHQHEGLPTTNGTRYIMISFIDP